MNTFTGRKSVHYGIVLFGRTHNLHCRDMMLGVARNNSSRSSSSSSSSSHGAKRDHRSRFRPRVPNQVRGERRSSLSVAALTHETALQQEGEASVDEMDMFEVPTSTTGMKRTQAVHRVNNNPQFLDGKPTLAYARTMPLTYASMSHAQIVQLSAEGFADARREALIRNIMTVDSVEYDDALPIFNRIAETNRRGLFLHHLGHHAGIGTALGGAFLSIPMIFHRGTVSWFNERYVTADVPEPKDLETWLEVGSWAWAWMEPVIGEISFLLLAASFARAQMTHLGLHPITKYFRELRAMRLVRAFPDYDPKLVADYSRCDTFYKS